MLEMTQAQWVKHTVMHPFEGFDDMRWKKSGSIVISGIIVLLLFMGTVAEGRLYGFQFYVTYDKTFNVIPYLVKSVILFGAWVVGNWSVCTLLDGEGTMKNICITSSYALIPYIVQMYLNIFLSHILIRDEYIFMQIINIIGVSWSILLMFNAVKAVHQYSVKKTFLAILLTVGAMMIMLILLVLFLSLIQQIYVFLYSLYTELSYRIRV